MKEKQTKKDQEKLPLTRGIIYSQSVLGEIAWK
ncbi:hypothetical protein MGMO_13c00100 [Methyloglobulus morosus KoM1]|uniref:Uncharacterized protein n=1 Tax=Methyloglobulus morosus KoM1 TaxID=1116472 RepID=V5E298_9GAMM|nr:hypothetical protein MGMO_13c00100 [Methyloglobulus morosus KoM1]